MHLTMYFRCSAKHNGHFFFFFLLFSLIAKEFGCALGHNSQVKFTSCVCTHSKWPYVNSSTAGVLPLLLSAVGLSLSTPSLCHGLGNQIIKPILNTEVNRLLVRAWGPLFG